MSPKPLFGSGQKFLFFLGCIAVMSGVLARPANVRAAAETCGPISNGTAAGFQIDGKLFCSGSGIDWYKAPGSGCLSLLDSPPGACSVPIPGLGNTLFVQDSVAGSVGNDPTVFSGSSNTNQDLIGAGQAPWHYGSGSTPPKDDLTEVYLNVRPPDINGDVWLVVGAAYVSTSGDKHFDFEFNQKGVTAANGFVTGNGTDGGRTSGPSGDIVLSIDYQQGGAAPCVHLRQWESVGGVFQFVQVNAQCLPFPGGPARDTAFSAVSGTNTPVPCLVFANSSGAGRTNHYDALQFAEGAVNLSCYLPGFNLGAFCNTVSTVMVKTRSSGSSGFGQAQLKDFLIAPFSLSVPPVANAGVDQAQCANVAGPNSFNLSGSCSSGNCGWSRVSGPSVTFGDASQCATTASFSGPGVAVLKLTCTAQAGCTAEDQVSLTVNANPVVTETHNNVKCFGGHDGSIDITVSGGKSPYTFAWADGPTTEDRSGLGPGNYSVTVTDANGCTGTGGATLTQPPQLTASATHVDVQCNGASTGSIDVTVSGGTTPYSFKWADGPTTEDRTGLAAGGYSVTVTDANGCTTTTGATIGQATNLSASATHVDVQCNGGSDGSIDVTASGGTPPYGYKWADGPTSEDRTGLAAGSYSVTVTDAHGCTATAGATIGQPPLLTASATHVDVKCNGNSTGSIDVTVSGGTTPYGFKWGDGPTTEDRTALAAGSYSVTVTDAHGCTATAGATIDQAPALTCTVAPPSATVCAGASASFTVTPSGGTGPYTTSWSGPGGFTSSALTITVSVAGTYTANITDSNGCPTSCSGTLIVNPIPNITATPDTLSCLKACGQLKASSTTPTVTYSWTGPNGFSSAQQNPAVCDSGTYTVTVTTSAGCTNSASAHVINITPILGGCGSGGPIASGFELDGDAFAVSPNPPDDWNLVLAGTDGATFTTGIVNDFPSKKDDYFQIGTKDLDDVTSWRYNVQSTPDKDDILHGGAAQYGSRLYFFGDRFDVSGDAQIGFWFLKDTVNVVVPGSTFTGTHSIGDILVLSNFVTGGGTPVIFAYEWVGSGGSDGSLNKLTLSAANSFAVVNASTQTSPWSYQAKGKVPANQYPPGAFFEGGIDLACLTGPGISACFSNFILETRSSQSVTASLKDFLIGRFSVEAGASLAAALKSGAAEGQLQSAAPVASDPTAAMPIEFYRPVPNPFFHTTRMAYAVAGNGEQVEIGVFDLAGRRVRNLVSAFQVGGRHEVNWDGRGDDGTVQHVGVYFIHTVIGDRQRTVRVAYLR